MKPTIKRAQRATQPRKPDPRDGLADVAQQIARVCIDEGLHFVGAVGRVLPDGERLSIVSAQVTENATVAALLAHSIGPMLRDSIRQAESQIRVQAKRPVDQHDLN